MQPNFRISSLTPRGLTVESVTCVQEMMIVAARAAAVAAKCPLCGTASRRVHSRYIRRASDLPCAGRGVRLRVTARRFYCEAPHCRRRIFAERFGDAVLAMRSRRTARLEHIVHHLGLALGGRPAANFAKRLMLPVSNDTLLRVVRRKAPRRTEPLSVVGVDDWAFRRNHRYGTIVCDLEKATDRELQKVPSARTIARLMTTARHHLSKADTVIIAAIEAGVPTLVETRTLIDRFHAMIRKTVETELVRGLLAQARA
jgi:transposase